MHRSVTHMPAYPALIGGRLIQRCAVCGEKLLDSGALQVCQVEGDGFTVPHYREYVLVRFRRGKGKLLPRHTKRLVVPEDFCIDLVEE